MNDTNTETNDTNTEAAAPKKAGRKPDWTNKDRTISVWVEDRGGTLIGKIAKKIPGTIPEYFKAYLNHKGVTLDASDIGSIMEGNSIFTEALQKKIKTDPAGTPDEKQEAPKYAGFLCYEGSRVEPWKSNPEKSDTIVQLATVLPRYRKDSKEMMGYLYRGKAFFNTVKHGDNVLGELEPRDVVRLVNEPGAVLKFGEYSVTLDRFEKQQGYDTENAYVSVVKGDPVRAQLLESEKESEQTSERVGARV